ncbi:MAG: aminoacyl-tRNA hydrolase [Ilumatobacteraceae bacterium]|jgi:PTH1 family peptidyl-tRNA hydrolase
MALFGRSSRPDRRGTPFSALIVGVGNPGREYERSRHNVGFEVIDELARRASVTMKAGRDKALVAEVHGEFLHYLLAKPMTYVNNSGQAVGPLARRYGVKEVERVVIVHDELDLPPGVVRVKVGGGLAGHNGLRSITQHLKSQDFVRVRIGVGKPPSKERGGDHVLGRIPGPERELLDASVQRAADAVEIILKHGVDTAMQQIHAE